MPAYKVPNHHIRVYEGLPPRPGAKSEEDAASTNPLTASRGSSASGRSDFATTGKAKPKKKGKVSDYEAKAEAARQRRAAMKESGTSGSSLGSVSSLSSSVTSASRNSRSSRTSNNALPAARPSWSGTAT